MMHSKQPFWYPFITVTVRVDFDAWQNLQKLYWNYKEYSKALHIHQKVNTEHWRNGKLKYTDMQSSNNQKP